MTEEKSNAPIEVMVRLKTHIQYDDDEENIELITFGTLHHMPNATYIRYIEHVENNGKINTTVKYDGDEMLIVIRTAFNLAHNFHDANYILFFKVKI